MVRRKSFFLIFFLIFFVGITPCFSQVKTSSLKAKRQKLEKEISYTNKLLAEVNKSKKIPFMNCSSSTTVLICGIG